jgi:Leucine-rich repeat (LRR) protein
MKPFRFYCLILLSISACSQAEKPVEKESTSVAIPNWKLPGVEAENERFSFCESVDTASLHPNAVKYLFLSDSLGVEDSKKLVNVLPRLKNLISLSFLNQSQLNLEPVFEAVQSSDSLQALHIDNCKINLRGKIRNLKRLKRLELWANNISEVPIDFLNSLNLERFEIKDWDNPFRFIGKLKHDNSLQDLWILGCSEKKLNSEFYKLTNLKRLSVHNSALVSVSPDIVRIKSLEELMIADCPLSKDENALILLRNQLHGKCSVKTEKDIPLPD